MTAKTTLKTREVNYVRVNRDQAGRRVDNLLVSLLADVPKSRIYRMLRRGEVRINGRRVRPEARVSEDDLLRLPPLHLEAPLSRPTVSSGREQFLRGLLLHEDNELIVVNKPAGMAVHGGSGLRFGLIDELRAARSEGEFLELAHRLDRDTSGCLIIAKDMRTLRRLHDALRAGLIAKSYVTLARGQWSGGTRTISLALKKNVRRGGERIVTVDPEGKAAVTRFGLRQQFRGACLLTVELGTGRTHQIRVHAAQAGFPIAGDQKYGEPAFNACLHRYGLRRLFLHAARVGIPRTNNRQPLVVEAPLPPDLEAIIGKLATETSGACDNDLTQA